MKRCAVLILMCVGMGSCDPRLPAGFVDPDVFEFVDEPTVPLSAAGKSFMNGVYEVVQGSSELGNPVVGKWIGNRWCLFSQHDVVFSVCAGGSSVDSIKLLGYVRYVRSGSGIRVRFLISSNNGAKELISGAIPPSLRIQGETEDHKKIELRRIGKVNPLRFEILAHRGGGRNSDRLGISENSIPMIRYAAVLGATGVELDVKRTRDDKLIVFHDDTFSPRTVQGAYLLGKVENYDLEQITSLGKLIYGEQIPTLSQALTAVIDDTELSLVWLDIKDPKAVGQVVQIQKDMMAYAATRGRDSVSILLGIPSQEVLNAYIPFKDSIFADAAVELGAEIAIWLPRCRVWGPSWTQNITPEDVKTVQSTMKMHSYMKVFTWTVDLREGVVDFLNRGVNGIVSNYPTLVAAIHDSRD
jgi:glycerophosphoryl diester phosphodiesterase